ncbi:hypothetical protein BpHYR1_004274 [Brachionus plicatilis]|uniref:Uncharacterized protein n=1 Tax=Brachionus plicatilis TaxID=10195 RepID=A0A3M7QPX6_BRAPC|nr:hypothetical protein BpHYR1_004274 [Brachionus plicatilis]
MPVDRTGPTKHKDYRNFLYNKFLKILVATYSGALIQLLLSTNKVLKRLGFIVKKINIEKSLFDLIKF